MGAKIPAAVYNSARVKGAIRIPETGYYAATVTKVEKGGNKPTTCMLTNMFENGFDTKSFIDLPFDEDGDILPGFIEVGADGTASFISEKAESTYNAMLNEAKAVFVSAGQGNETEATLDVDDLVNKRVYVEWHSSKDTGRKYGKVVGYLSKARYDSLIAANAKPIIAGAAEATAAAAEGATSAPTVAAPKVTVPANGTIVTRATPKVPRPSIVARGLIPGT